jgi:uncharacterized protein DUF3482/50S ribosome-binding GTPase
MELNDTAGALQTVNLSLISHTNAGKTTLARTLLRQDVGEVRDEPHVTELSEVYTMLETGDGAALRLWDTPGFGDSARLLRRLRMSGNPLGWMLSQVWDRFADRPQWCSQQAVRNVRDVADVVLYLVNAAEDPAEAGYVEMEMEILGWIGKPIIVLLNQLGPPRGQAADAADAQKWRSHLARFDAVRKVLSLDAFARCWVQEGTLFRAIAELIPAEKRANYDRLSDAWLAKNLAAFHSSMRALAIQLGRAACDREIIETKSWPDKALGLLRYLVDRNRAASSEERAMAMLAERFDYDVRETTDRLIVLHGLTGHAGGEILKRLKENYSATEPIDAGVAATIGGVVSGALTGLIADLTSGGLTFGAAAVSGGILGALGAGGLAKGYNLVRGAENATLRWSGQFFEGAVRAALLRYLAVAHFGRGRGDYTESEAPKHWQSEVARIVESRRRELQLIWEDIRNQEITERISTRLERLITACAEQLLKNLYPTDTSLGAQSGACSTNVSPL